MTTPDESGKDPVEKLLRAAPLPASRMATKRVAELAARAKDLATPLPVRRIGIGILASAAAVVLVAVGAMFVLAPPPDGAGVTPTKGAGTDNGTRHDGATSPEHVDATNRPQPDGPPPGPQPTGAPGPRVPLGELVNIPASGTLTERDFDGSGTGGPGGPPGGPIGPASISPLDQLRQLAIARPGVLEPGVLPNDHEVLQLVEQPSGSLGTVIWLHVRTPRGPLVVGQLPDSAITVFADFQLPDGWVSVSDQAGTTAVFVASPAATAAALRRIVAGMRRVR